ncbi:apolipoprotein N-acyltransferase [Oscillatoria amoena NRMC-F 0135]|nr:apolipoprotein N-acyltransferase [Oscillatoria amoena NRMC-F 0135]
MLAALFPKFEFSGAAWLALTPLVFVLRGSKLRGGDETPMTLSQDDDGTHTLPPGGVARPEPPPEQFARLSWREAFGWGWFAGVIYHVISLSWIGHVTIGGMLVLAGYLSIATGLWAMLIALLWRNNRILSSMSNVHFALAGASGWVVLEWIKSHFLTGFPWNNLGVALHGNLPMIQIADHFGVYGISFIIVFTNLTLLLTVLRLDREIRLMIRQRNDFQVFRLRPHLDFTLGMVLVVVTYGYGLACLFEKKPSGTIPVRVALVQGNIPQNQKWNAERFYSILDTYIGLTESAALTRPDLIVWPESATPAGYLQNREVFDAVDALTREGGFDFIFGSNDVIDKRDYTGAFFIGRGQETFEFYHKMHLVPYGEYVPLGRWMPWMRKVVPIGNGFFPGTDPKVFTLTQSKLRVAPLVCFEDLFPALARERTLRGADAFVNLTNGGWYGESAGIFQHVANAVFRSVETRRPTIRATNTGVSCWIDPHGRIRDRMSPFVAGFQVTSVDILPGAPVTFYTRHGNVFVVGCLIILTLALVRNILWQRKSFSTFVN